MFSNFKLISVLVFCFIYKCNCDPEAPLRFQRFRQPQFFARQQAAPYAPAGSQPNVPFDLPSESRTPNTQYGAPPPPPPPPPPSLEPLPSTAYGVPSTSYGVPIGATSQLLGTRDTELSSNEAVDPDAEILTDAAPARLRSQKLRKQPARQQQFQRLRAQSPQQQHHQLQLQQLRQQQQFREFQQLQQLQQQQQGSYFIQLPNGSIQRVAYSTLSDPQDNTVSAQLKFRPVALAATEAQVLQPQPLFVNTFVSSYTAE